MIGQFEFNDLEIDLAGHPVIVLEGDATVDINGVIVSVRLPLTVAPEQAPRWIEVAPGHPLYAPLRKAIADEYADQITDLIEDYRASKSDRLSDALYSRSY